MVPTHRSMVYLRCLHVTGHIPFASGANINIPFRKDLRVPTPGNGYHMRAGDLPGPCVYCSSQTFGKRDKHIGNSCLSSLLLLHLPATSPSPSRWHCSAVCSSFLPACLCFLLFRRLLYVALRAAGLPAVGRHPVLFSVFVPRWQPRHQPSAPPPFAFRCAVFPFATYTCRPFCGHFSSVLLSAMFCLRLCFLRLEALLFSSPFSFRDGIPDIGNGACRFFFCCPPRDFRLRCSYPLYCFADASPGNGAIPAVVTDLVTIARTMLRQPSCLLYVAYAASRPAPCLLRTSQAHSAAVCVPVSTWRQKISFRPCVYCRPYTVVSVRTSHKLQTKKPLTTCQTKVKLVRTAKKCKSASRFDHPVVWVFLIWSHSHMGPQNTANLTQQKGWRKERYIWPIDVQSMAGITLRSCRPSAGTSQKCRLHREIFGVFFDDWRPVDLGPFAEALQQETPTGRDYSWMVHASNNQKSQWSQVSCSISTNIWDFNGIFHITLSFQSCNTQPLCCPFWVLLHNRDRGGPRMRG